MIHSRLKSAAAPGLALALAFLALAPKAFPQATSYPKPGPEAQRLQVWVGKWVYEGTEFATPLGVAGTFKGKSTNRLLANGHVLEIHSVEKTSDWLSLTSWDPATRRYLSTSYQPSGAVSVGPITIDGSTWVTHGELRDAQGKVWKTRSTQILSPDGKRTTDRQEYSGDDGKTWLPWWESRSRKVSR